MKIGAHKFANLLKLLNQGFCCVRKEDRDRNAARITVGRELPTRTLSVVRRVPISTIVYVSASPPFHAGRSDFPSPVGDHGISPYSLPYAAEA